MGRISKFVVAWLAMGLLMAAAGCGSSNEPGSASADAGSAGAGSEDAGRQSPEPSAAAPTGALPDETTPEPVRPVVVLQTSMGEITVELDDEKAPATVENFLKYAESGFYDQTIYHQVFRGAVILGGMFTADLTQKQAGPVVTNEAHNGLKNVRGTIAMAREYDRIDSATSGFFINVQDNPNYDHKPEARDNYDRPEDYGYCVFGKVIQGMEVVDQIANVEVHDTAEFERIPVQVRTVLIESVRRTR